MRDYAVECYPKGWDEPFKREIFEDKQRAFAHATYMTLYYPKVEVYCLEWTAGQMGTERYLVKSIIAKR